MSSSVVSLELHALMDEAQQRSGGLTDTGSGPFVDPLKRLISSLESEARLNSIGRVIASERILGHTVNRLHYVNDRKRFPEIAEEEITQPANIATSKCHEVPAFRAAMRTRTPVSRPVEACA